ncbi:NAD(P)-binding protein [Aureobasidium pullulans]|uniref:NAD(P)-binding protein n=1 Tax=Aureobasidium pullulans TaxID=5580 RepID=A0A4S9AZL5_AURPU|nr:NAD(P)-binding protein [Aureobasidium pullulans]
MGVTSSCGSGPSKFLLFQTSHEKKNKMALTHYSAPPTSDISPVIGEVNDETTWPLYNPRRKPGQTVYVITGANRGLGLALTTTLALRPSTVIFACIRTFTPETTEVLTSLSVGQDSYVAPIQVDATVSLHAKQAVETITHMHGYNHVDVVIANSGISEYYGTAAETPLEALRTHFEVNTIGPLALFQAFLPLLSAIRTSKIRGDEFRRCEFERHGTHALDASHRLWRKQSSSKLHCEKDTF